MSGLPRHPVPCVRCGKPIAPPATGVCGPCRMHAVPNPRLKYRWTEEHLTALRRLYAGVRSKAELSAGLSDLARRTGFPRHIVLLKAQRMGLARTHWRPWSPQELDLLREFGGTLTAYQMSRFIGRSRLAIAGMMKRRGISQRITEGYSQLEVAELLGVSEHTVRDWLRRGWLLLDHTPPNQRGRVAHGDLVEFLKDHAEEYDLRRVDQTWFKGALFPKFGLAARDGRRAVGADRRQREERSA